MKPNMGGSDPDSFASNALSLFPRITRQEPNLWAMLVAFFAGIVGYFS